ncbi:hypothetical protein [Burkholderia sp. Bp9142]|uniref:hypothetical protein n=1 Tax=Burkholderia sp. Bp9142 TaxID=2184573 RepID=UPI000F594298|nr:hypothetical protein [Burkholderia sp. Bp9142]RQR34825.1 hypothetical protein DIE22_16180 [Burkholderia sp. Bp9142]
MNVASTEMTRACLLGGHWQGHRVESFLERFTGTADYAEDLDDLDFLISDVVNFFPYIHYEPDTGKVLKVTNCAAFYALDREDQMLEVEGLSVARMRMPDDDTLYEWYQAYVEKRGQ